MTKHLWPSLRDFLPKIYLKSRRRKNKKEEEFHLAPYLFLYFKTPNSLLCDINLIQITHQWFWLYHSNLEAFSKSSSLLRLRNFKTSGSQLLPPSQAAPSPPNFQGLNQEFKLQWEVLQFKPWFKTGHLPQVKVSLPFPWALSPSFPLSSIRISLKTPAEQILLQHK